MLKKVTAHNRKAINGSNETTETIEAT